MKQRNRFGGAQHSVFRLQLGLFIYIYLYNIYMSVSSSANETPSSQRAAKASMATDFPRIRVAIFVSAEMK